jgi:predicted nucleotidyltransferase
MSLDIDIWLNNYSAAVKCLFGSRLIFLGIQGSYGRGEATENSDIDVIVILDYVNLADLKAYSSMLDTLEHREKVCGFISGKQELLNWESFDLFQFYHDTSPLFGDIDFLIPVISMFDTCHRAIHIGACNIYHMCGHNIVHEKNTEILKSLYKSAAFVVQAIVFDQTGVYIKQKAALADAVHEREKKILQAGRLLKEQQNISQSDFEQLSELLFNWSSELITKYKVN